MSGSDGRRAQLSGALLMALATAIGALGTHALKARLPADRYAVLQTAVLYQFLGALGLLCVGILQALRGSRALRVAADVLLAGAILFSGSLYLLLIGAPRWLGVLTPVGGAGLIVGWCLVARALWRGADAGGS